MSEELELKRLEPSDENIDAVLDSIGSVMVFDIPMSIKAIRMTFYFDYSQKEDLEKFVEDKIADYIVVLKKVTKE